MAYQGAYTLTEFELYPDVVVVGFVDSRKQAARIEAAGGLLWTSYEDAEETADLVNECEGRALSFAEDVELIGRRVFVPGRP